MIGNQTHQHDINPFLFSFCADQCFDWRHLLKNIYKLVVKKDVVWQKVLKTKLRNKLKSKRKYFYNEDYLLQ